MQIRKAMAEGAQRQLLQGIVEMDECYIGGKPRKGGSNGPAKRGRGTKKTPVVGMIERGGNIVARMARKNTLSSKPISALVREHVDVKNATLFTDEYSGYVGIKKFMPHSVINHSVWYVDGNVHTNSVESFWALLKRGIIGQYHKVSVRHLPKYLSEFCYRFNGRKDPDLFNLTLSHALGVVQ